MRDGEDAVIVAAGGILAEAVAAADALAAEGMEVRVIDVHTVKPLDTATIVEAVRACGHVVTLEEHNVVGGLGAAVAEACLDAGVAPRSFRRLGLADRFPEIVGDQAFLRRAYGMDRDAVIAVLRAVR